MTLILTYVIVTLSDLYPHNFHNCNWSREEEGVRVALRGKSKPTCNSTIVEVVCS